MRERERERETLFGINVHNGGSCERAIYREERETGRGDEKVRERDRERERERETFRDSDSDRDV